MTKRAKKASARKSRKRLIPPGKTRAYQVDASLDRLPNEEEVLRVLQPELDALSDGELLRVNLNIPTVVTTVLGVAPRLRELRPAIAQRLPDFDLRRFDKLESYALALSSTHAAHSVTKSSTPKLPALQAEAWTLRAMLRADARALVLRGHVVPKKLRALSKKRGYLNLVNDLGILVNVLREVAPRLEGRWSVSKSEIERAAELSVQIIALVRGRNAPSLAAQSTANARARAFTLLLRAYDDARRAVCYLTWHEGTLDEIAPPLRGAPGKKRVRRTTGETASSHAAPRNMPT
jgi:hypothetical protein